MEFVTFEIAKKLKEKGFNEYSDMSYTKIGLINDTEIYRESNEFYCYAPTISQVLKWLRNKQIIITPIPSYFDAAGYCSFWECDIWAGDNYEEYRKESKSYEEAALSAIEYVLNNLI